MPFERFPGVSHQTGLLLNSGTFCPSTSGNPSLLQQSPRKAPDGRALGYPPSLGVTRPQTLSPNGVRLTKFLNNTRKFFEVHFEHSVVDYFAPKKKYPVVHSRLSPRPSDYNPYTHYKKKAMDTRPSDTSEEKALLPPAARAQLCFLRKGRHPPTQTGLCRQKHKHYYPPSPFFSPPHRNH